MVGAGLAAVGALARCFLHMCRKLILVLVYKQLFAVAVWASCYAGPNIVEKLYSRKRARALQQKLGVVYFVLSGPGFLTIMKSLMKPLFCSFSGNVSKEKLSFI